MSGLEGQRKISVEHAAALLLAKDINHLVGTTATLLVAPAGATHMVMKVEANDFRARLGDYVAAVFTTTFATDMLNITGHGRKTGDGPFQVSSSTTLPAGLLAATNYWIIEGTDGDEFQVATSKANALAGTQVPLTDDGTGTHTFQPDEVAAAAAPAGSVVDGTGSIELPADSELILPAPAEITLQGFGAGPILTYYWV